MTSTGDEFVAMVFAFELPENECWEWPYVNAKGYGRTKIKGRQFYCHRLMAAAIYGPIPDDMQVDHLCHNRACCNPLHLEVVDYSTNQKRRRDRS